MREKFAGKKLFCLLMLQIIPEKAVFKGSCHQRIDNGFPVHGQGVVPDYIARHCC
jgi:hypothetical protein